MLAAGPRRPAAHAEVRRLAQVMPEARLLTGPAATADAQRAFGAAGTGPARATAAAFVCFGAG
ncbi:hypothetical protein [Micromonospora deserti]|uniref:Uncharacterized protein n=1 Tax=Micromonospora deserti TaxID=2070366 RepID=A0A2W2CGH7_9ACTN|nr:hypothetical protein [Micromonospora deserti]PZF97652.1 hypothetical protein C1I99_15095 [Micromonospora deserti]